MFIIRKQNPETHNKKIDASIFAKKTGFPPIHLMKELVSEIDSLGQYAALVDLVCEVVSEYNKQKHNKELEFYDFLKELLKSDYCREKISELKI